MRTRQTTEATRSAFGFPLADQVANRSSFFTLCKLTQSKFIKLLKSDLAVVLKRVQGPGNQYVA